LKIGGKQILNTVSGSCHHGQISAILGVSGAGKTTMLNLLSRRIALGRKSKLSGAIKYNKKKLSVKKTL